MIQHTRFLVFCLFAAQVLVSANSMIVEIVAGRVLAPYVGMSLYTWTAIIAVVLAGFSAGHWVGGWVAHKPRDRALRITAGWTMAAAVSTAAIVFIVRQSAAIALPMFETQVPAILVLTTLAFFVPSFCAGIPAPVLTQIAIDLDPAKSASRLGTMFAAGAIGAIFGTLGSGFLFISWLGTSITLLVVTCAYVALAVGFWVMSGTVRSLFWLLILVGAGAIGIAGAAQSIQPICDRETDYFCIRTIDLSDDPDRPVRAMVLDHLVHGASAQSEPDIMYTDHAAVLEALARIMRPSDAFSAYFIGGGTYSIPRKWQGNFPQARLSVSEIDPVVTQIAAQNFWYNPTGADIIHQDARSHLNQTTDTFDIIIGDAFTDIAVPEHLITREFFETVRSRLTADGRYYMNVIDYTDRLAVLGSMVRTLQSVFPTVEIWVEARQPGPAERMVFILVAGTEKSPIDQITVRSPMPLQYAAMSDDFVTMLAQRATSRIFTDDFTPIARMLGQRFD